MQRNYDVLYATITIYYYYDVLYSNIEKVILILLYEIRTQNCKSLLIIVYKTTLSTNKIFRKFFKLLMEHSCFQYNKNSVKKAFGICFWINKSLKWIFYSFFSASLPKISISTSNFSSISRLKFKGLPTVSNLLYYSSKRNFSVWIKCWSSYMDRVGSSL